jgi:hypothetical protein
VLIAIPLLTIIASVYTFYLAVSHPDYLVVEEEEYNSIVEELRAELSPGPDGLTTAVSIAVNPSLPALN